MKKILLTHLCLLSFIVFSQTKSSKDNTISFFFSGASSKIKNQNYTNDKYNSIHFPVCFNQGLSYTKYFSSHFGFTFGVEYSNYKNYLGCHQYYQSTSTVKGPDGSDYYPIIIADYKQDRKLNAIEIPLLFRIESGASSSRARLFSDIGLKICSTFSSTCETNGTITRQGIWASNNPFFWTFSQNNTYYDFRTVNLSTNNDYRYKTINYALFVNAGLLLPMNDHFNFTCSGYYTFGLKDINESDKDVPYKNFMGEESDYKPSKIRSLGLRLGVSVFL